jgi:hypothetical protein
VIIAAQQQQQQQLGPLRGPDGAEIDDDIDDIEEEPDRFAYSAPQFGRGTGPAIHQEAEQPVGFGPQPGMNADGSEQTEGRERYNSERQPRYDNQGQGERQPHDRNNQDRPQGGQDRNNQDRNSQDRNGQDRNGGRDRFGRRNRFQRPDREGSDRNGGQDRPQGERFEPRGDRFEPRPQDNAGPNTPQQAAPQGSAPEASFPENAEQQDRNYRDTRRERFDNRRDRFEARRDQAPRTSHDDSEPEGGLPAFLTNPTRIPAAAPEPAPVSEQAPASEDDVAKPRRGRGRPRKTDTAAE